MEVNREVIHVIQWITTNIPSRLKQQDTSPEQVILFLELAQTRSRRRRPGSFMR